MLQYKTRKRIENVIYKQGINVALYHVENSDWYKQFMEDTQSAISTQVKQVAKQSHIDNLLLFTKAKETNPSLVAQIGALMQDLAELIGLNEFLIRAGVEGGQAFFDKTGIESQFVMKNPELIAYFEDHSRLLIDSVDNTTKEWIANKIQEGKDQLLDAREIVNSILDETEVFSRFRAETIVLTETANAMMITELAVAKEYGIKEIIWRTSIDDRVCPICLPLEGERTAIGKSFPDGYNHPPAHPRCRCFVEEVIPEDWSF